jgi:hypothetical protein
MGGKDREHGALIVGGEVEEGVERQDHVEAAAKGQAAHIGVDRLGPRHADLELRDHRRRAVHAGHPVAARDEPCRDRLPRSAAEVQHASPGARPSTAATSAGASHSV